MLRSHDELRAVLQMAGAEIRNRRDSPLLQLMRRVLREARIVAKAEEAKTAAKSAGA